MNPSLRVLTPGLHTTVQDLGRIGYQSVGVPVSGALDGYGLRLANALVGNPQGMAGLEVLINGPTIEIAADAVRVALVGAGARLAVGGERPRNVAEGRSVTLSCGETVQLVVGQASACCYLAIAGGLAVPSVLGSASTYVRAGIGGFNGRPLQRGDIVPLSMPSVAEGTELQVSEPCVATGDQPIRVILGPQQERFTEEAVRLLLGAEFKVSQHADRMGMRLQGPLLGHRGGWDIVSDAIATGSVQVPGSGQPIILLADHQTTGGYPKIATVISADLGVVGARRPGDTLRFVAVELEAAEKICREREARFAERVAALEPATGGRTVDFGSLYGENLISGVVSGVK
jgi:biotin-dependent carboxylase-like uncharacterized protein